MRVPHAWSKKVARAGERRRRRQRAASVGVGVGDGERAAAAVARRARWNEVRPATPPRPVVEHAAPLKHLDWVAPESRAAGAMGEGVSAVTNEKVAFLRLLLLRDARATRTQRDRMMM